MYKWLRTIVIVLIIVFVLQCFERNISWREIYLNSIMSGAIPEQVTTMSDYMVDINLDGIPEIAVKHLDYNGELYGLRHGKLEKIGYTAFQELGLYRNKLTGRLQWINTYWYKYYSSGTVYGINYVD